MYFNSKSKLYKTKAMSFSNENEFLQNGVIKFSQRRVRKE